MEDLVSLFKEGCQATGLHFWRMLNRRNGFDLHEIFEKATKIEPQSDIPENEQVQGVYLMAYSDFDNSEGREQDSTEKQETSAE
jgi:hypothetical protein